MSGLARSPEDFLGYTIVRLADVLHKEMDATLATVGLTARQFSVLLLLADRSDITGGELARLVLVTPQSMSELVASLVAQRLVRRAENTGRGRALPISITPLGRRHLESAFPLVAALEARLSRGLRRDQVAETNRQLHALLAALVAGEA